MARSKQSFNKREKEIRKLKNRQDKAQKMEERKSNNDKGKTLEDMMVYLDENGNLSPVPPSGNHQPDQRNSQ